MQDADSQTDHYQFNDKQILADEFKDATIEITE